MVVDYLLVLILFSRVLIQTFDLKANDKRGWLTSTNSREIKKESSLLFWVTCQMGVGWLLVLPDPSTEGGHGAV